jgi:hypothetical protein
MGRRRRDNPTLTFSLCVSLVAHALAMSAIAWWFVKHAPPTYVAGPTEAELIVLRPPPAPPPPRPKPHHRPPPPPMPAEEPDPTLKDDSGEHDGHGTANRSTPGDHPMRAERGPEQADLRRTLKPDPTLIDPTAARAAQAGRRQPDDALPISPTTPQRGTYQPDFVAAADAARADPAGQVVHRSSTVGVGPLPPSPVVATPTDDAPPPTPSGVRDSAVETSPTVAAPPPPREVRGRDATASDTDSVPFAKETTVEFHAGRVDGRQGAKVQLFSPRWGLASEDYLGDVQELRAVLGAYVRPDGSVANVVVFQSSGSPNVDLDCERAVYDGTFEPRKDKAGHPVATLWTIVYH